MKHADAPAATIKIEAHGSHAPEHAVHIHECTVTKWNVPELIRIEAEKTRQAYAIANQCGLFKVPRVLSCNEDKGEMVLERINGLTPLCKLNKRDPAYTMAVEQLGRGLAVLHKEFFLPDCTSYPLPDVFSWPGTEVFIHGDLDTSNVCMDMNTSTLVILDWQTTSRYNEKTVYGSRYFDLAWFIEGLLWPDHAFLFGDPVTPLIERFVRSYMSESCRSRDLGKLGTYLNDIFAWKGVLERDYLGERRYLNLRRRILTRRCIERIDRMSKA